LKIDPTGSRGATIHQDTNQHWQQPLRVVPGQPGRLGDGGNSSGIGKIQVPGRPGERQEEPVKNQAAQL
jgi:hypothetical protein